LSRGLIEKEAPFFFELQPSHNYFGAVEVLAYDSHSDPQRLELGVWDGPHSGEHLIISIKPIDPKEPIPRGKFYLRKSIEDIKAESLRDEGIVYDLKELLRKGLSLYQGEPYVPRNIDKTDASQPPQEPPVSAPR